MSLEEERVNQNEGVRGLLNEDHKAELGKILAFGEKYKKEGEEMKKKYRNNNERAEFGNLILQYEESKENFIEGLSQKERDILDNLGGIVRKKFYEEYLYNRILYGGDWYKKYDKGMIGYICDGSFESWVIKEKEKLHPGMHIDIWEKYIRDDGVKILAREWKDKLQPGMDIYLGNNGISVEGIKVLAKEWKGKLKPGMCIDLGGNRIGNEGVEALTKGWKDSLQPGMRIDLWNYFLGDEALKILARERKDSLKEGMEIDISSGTIGDDGVKVLAKEWKGKLKPGMYLDLDVNMGDEGVDYIMNNWELKEGMTIKLRMMGVGKEKEDELRKRIQGYKDNGINCKVVLD